MSAVIEAPQLFTPEQAAERLAVSVHTVHRLRKEGQLKPVKIGAGSGSRLRYSAAELQRYVDTLTESP